jgi:hypothetical protein
MTLPSPAERRARLRQLVVLREPRLWPFLPVVRRDPGRPAEGVLFDARRLAGVYGYSATVFRTNLFALPPTEAALLALPREVYDTPEEVYAAGWRVD